MPQTFGQYLGDGTNANFAVPFQYIAKAHVGATVNGAPATFSWLNTQLIHFDTAPQVGAVIEIRRKTPNDRRAVDFVDGSTLTEGDLDLAATQFLFLSQEAADMASTGLNLTNSGVFDFTLHRGVNAADPVDPSDVATRRWTETGMTSQLTQATAARATAVSAKASAEAARDTSVGAQNTAVGARDATVAARDVTLAARDAASQSATTATAKATAAAASAASAQAAVDTPGRKGDTGLKGDTGAAGTQGAKGDTGATGAQGLKGDTGVQGLKGDTGAQGAPGLQGLKGDTGATGTQGLKGDTGVTGSQGLKGDKGDTGSTGIQGAKGDKGDQGNTGPAGSVGDLTPYAKLAGPQFKTAYALSAASSTAGTDAKQWDQYSGPDGSLHFRTVNDAYSSAIPWLSVYRSGLLTTNISFTVRPAFAGNIPWDSGNFDPTGKMNLTGGQFTGVVSTRGTVGGIAQGEYAGTLQVLAAGASDAAFMTFCRPGNYANYFGLDTDNQLSFGGWSSGLNSYKVFHQGNFETYSKTTTRFPGITRLVADKLRDLPHIYDAVDAGVSRSGISDWAPYLNAALATGGRFVLPRSALNVSNNIVVSADGCGLIGQGYGSTLVSNSSTGDIFTVGKAGGAEISGLSFRDFTVNSSVTQSGAAFRGTFVTDSEFIGVRIYSRDLYFLQGGHRMADGYVFNKLNTSCILGGEVVVNGTGVQMWTGAELCLDDAVRFFRNNYAAVYMRGDFGGLYLQQVEISEGGYGVLVDASKTGTQNRELFIQSSAAIDNTDNWGINIEPSSLAFFEGNGGWVSGCGKANNGSGGVRVAPPANAGEPTVVMRLNGFNVKSNLGSGVEFSGGLLSVTGGTYLSNGKGQTGGHGIHAAGGSLMSSVNVSGAQLYQNGTVSKGRGLVINGQPSLYCINGNSFFSNAQGAAALDAARDINHVVAGNAGFA